MEQLTLELAASEPPVFANFVARSNEEAVNAMRRLATGALDETAIVLWGAPGAGKSHLLRAAVSAATANGRAARYFAGPALVDAEPFAHRALVCVDDVDAADAVAQACLFTLYNALAMSGGQLAAAACAAPARLRLREDLRTRLAHGLVYEIVALKDGDKREALAGYSAERGFRLPNDVIDYLLAHGRRDMPTLVATIAAIDRYSLATKRPVTVPLLREWMQRNAADAGGGPPV